MNATGFQIGAAVTAAAVVGTTTFLLSEKLEDTHGAKQNGGKGAWAPVTNMNVLGASAVGLAAFGASKALKVGNPGGIGFTVTMAGLVGNLVGGLASLAVD